jgi:eukaryotic-like serine/threonine-protein kinase
MSANVPAETTTPTGPIAVGSLLGGRFLVEEEGHTDSLGKTWLARDQKTRKPIAIHVLSAAIAADRAAYDVFREEARTAAKHKHKSLVAIYGVGTHGGREHFLAQEWVAGQNLGELAAQRTREQRPLSVRGCFNVIAHTCKALTAVHELSCHGAVRPSIVWISKTGRVKLGDLGVGLALIKSRKWSLLPAEDQAFLAPEVKAGHMPDVRSDVFGVGALLYVLLTGRSPNDEFAAPSQVHPDATPELDAILLRCLAMDPAARFPSPEAVVQALLPLTASSPESEVGEFGASNMEIDVDIAFSLAPPAPSHAPGPIVINIGQPKLPNFETPRPPNVLRAPAQTPVASPAPAVGGTPAQARPQASAPAQAGVDIGELTARLTKNDAPRWMCVKNGMDHGPFTTREVIKGIVDGEILDDHQLFNMTTNDRKLLREMPDFGPFVQQYKIRKDERDHAVALERSNKVEKRSTAAKFMILSVSVGVVLLAGAGYLMSRQSAKERAAQKDMDLAALYDSGQVKITGTAGILQYTARAGAKRTGGGGGGAAPGGFSSYEDAMMQAMEMGDATKGGGEKQLSPGDVAGVMNRNLNRLFACVGDELRQGGKLGKVSMDMAILGSGKVAGASVKPGSAGFQRCIVNKLQGIQFPSFPAPRMGARYSFDVN